jgi:transposase InsO family protein
MKNMSWELGVQIEHVAPYTPQQNGKEERQFPTNLKIANAMLDMVKLSAGIKQKLRKEATRYATTMSNISIKNDKSPHERFFGTPSPINPEQCINLGRIGYTTYGQKLKSKYKPRALKCYMVGNAEDHNPHTYKVFKYVPNRPGEIIITRNVKREHWGHPYKSQSSVIQIQSVNQPPVLINQHSPEWKA